MSRRIGSLVIAGELCTARDLLLNSPDVSVLPIPSSKAFRTVLQGPDLRFATANSPYFNLVGNREFIGLPVREALPELRGQGYFELLAHVYKTREPFIGRSMPIMLQPKPGAPIEEHVIDFVYRPIENAAGRVAGLFVEGYDRTQQARS